MTELNTLKDIDWTRFGIERTILLRYQEDLRQEAIKWAKHYKEIWNIDGKNAMTHFFNLTEEDIDG